MGLLEISQECRGVTENMRRTGGVLLGGRAGQELVMALCEGRERKMRDFISLLFPGNWVSATYQVWEMLSFLVGRVETKYSPFLPHKAVWMTK